MPRRHILYAYVDGPEFDDYAKPIEDRFRILAHTRAWISGDAWTVNVRREVADGEYDWELGINLELPDPYTEPPGWFSDVEEIAIVSRQLANDFAIEIVLGIASTEHQVSDDLFFIDSGPLDIEALRRIIGDGPP